MLNISQNTEGSNDPTKLESGNTKLITLLRENLRLLTDYARSLDEKRKNGHKKKAA